MVKINGVTGLSKVVKPIANNRAAKVVPVAIAGVTGVSVLSGASGGPAWQFESTPPKGVEIGESIGSIDDGVLETLSKKIGYCADLTGVSDKLDDIKEVIGEKAEAVKEGLEDWAKEVVEVLSDFI